MSTFKATNKRKTKDNDVFKATSQRSYDSALVGRWESGAKASFEALKKYSAKIGNNEYLSKKDLEDYKSAMDSYVDNSNRLRKINSSFGKGYSEDEEKQWADYISTLQTDYNQLSKYYSQFKTEDEHYANKNLGKYYNYSYSDIKNRISALEKMKEKSVMSGLYDEKEIQRELDWLKTYSTSKSYSTLEEYDVAIADVENNLKNTDKEYTQMKLRYGTDDDMAGYLQQLREKIDGLKADKEILKANRTIANRQFKVEKTTNDVLNSPTFEADYQAGLNANMPIEDIVKYYNEYENLRRSNDYQAQKKYMKQHGMESMSFEDLKTADWYPKNRVAFYREYMKYFSNGGTPLIGITKERLENKELLSSNNPWADIFHNKGYGYINHLTDDEYKVYNALFYSKGEDAATEYAYGTLRNTLEKREAVSEAEKLAKEYAEADTWGKIGMNLTSIPANVFGGVNAFIDDLGSYITEGEIHPYSSAHSQQQYAQGVRQLTAQDIASQIENETLAAFATNTYQAVMSGADSIVGVATLGKGYSLTMAMGAASQKARELYESGASDSQIALGAVLSGSIEYFTEKVSLDFLLKPKDLASVKAVLGAVLAQGGVEASEEVSSELLNMVADSIIQGYNTADEREVRRLMLENGISEEEARKQVGLGNALDVFWAAYGGFVSGSGTSAVMSAPAAVSAIRYNTSGKYIEKGSQIANAGNVQSLIESAATLPNTKANNKVKGYADNINGVDVSTLSKGGKNSYYKNVGKLYSGVQQANQEALLKSEETTRKNAIRQALEAKGVSKQDIQKATDAVYKAMYVSGVSSIESKLIEKVGGKKLLSEIAKLDSTTIKGNVANSQVEALVKMIDTEALTSKNQDVVETTPLESKFESNLEGKDFNSANDKIIASKKLVSSEKDNMKFEVVYDDGTTDTVDANNINFGNEGESLVYSYVMDMNIPVGIAESLVGLYKGNDSNSAAEYISGMREAFVLGKYNQEADLRSGKYASQLTDEQRSNAFKLGQIYAKEKAASEEKAIKGESKPTNIKKQEGKVHFEGDKLSLKSVQDVSLESLGVLSKALGKDFHIFESYKDANGNRVYKDANGNIKKAPNGFYNQADGSIWIDLNAGKHGEGMMLYTVAHELTHFIKQWSPTKFKALADFLVEQYGKEGVSVADLVRKQQAKAKRNNRELSYDEAFEEMVADSMESMLVDGEVIRKLAQKDKGLFNKIKAWIDNLLNRLKEVYKGYSPDSKEGNMVLEMQKSFKQIQELFADALADASDNFAIRGQKNTTSKGDVKMSVREIIGEDGTNYGVGVYLDSELLTKLTESQRKDKIKEFVINELSGGHFIAYDNNNDAVDIKIAHKHDNFKNQSGKPHKVLKELYHKHNDLVIKQEAVVLIDELIANAKYDSSASSTYSHGWLDNNGKNDWDYWKVFIQEKNKTVWEATLNIANTANGEKILYDIDPIKKVEEAIKSASNTTDNIIHQTNGKSQEKLSDRDTLGNTLTEAQQTYFAESKVRDDNGNLKVMYHGTPNATFTKFRSGTYFTEHKWYADNYQNQGASSLSYKKTADNPDTYSVYLDIKKPFDTRNKKERDIFYKEYYQQWGTGTDLMESGLPDWLDGQDLQEFLEEQGYDYDGLILDEGATGGYGEEVTSRGLSYVVFNPEQVKSVDNKTPTDNPDYRFSMRENVEETKDLVAVHNLSEEKLLKSLQLGGLPMPSIAIIKAKEGHNTFGNISLVFNKETIDPQFMRANKVYSGDAWTPTYPRVEHKVNDKAQKKIANRINNLVPEEVLRGLGGLHIDSYNLEQDLNRHNGNLVEMFRYNTALKYVFLTENGVQLELPNKFKPLGRYSNRDNDAIIRVAENVSEEKLRGITGGYTNEQIYEVEPEIRKAVNGYLQEKYKKLPEKALAKLISEDKMSIGQMFDLAIDALNYLTDGIKQEVDYYAARDLIDKTIDAQKYESWIKEVFANIVEKEGIRNNKDMFTPSGNRRSFEALHYEHNLENVIKAMKEDGTKGIGSFGRGNIFGASTTEYGSIAEIKEDAQNRMKQIPEEKYEEIRKGFSERFFELAYSLPIHKDSFTATDSASTMLVEAVAKFKTKSGMANYLRNESKGWANYSDYVVDDLIQLVSEIRQMPVGYFEAKPQRAVGFDEVATAIIPDSASAELKQKLTDYGIKFVEYESKNEESRLEALNSLEDVKFSDRDSEGNELSKEQQEFFKDSKVRDENGNLVTLYHGTDNGGFTVFDASKSDDKTSLFLTASKEMAQTYAISSKEIQLDGTSGQSGIYSVYANIINPYVVDAKGKNWDNIRTGLNPFLQSTRDIAQKAKKKGYDGVIIKNLVDAGGYSFMSGEKVAPSTVVIAFNSNQIKSISNTNPTTNPDIRYSSRIEADMSEEERYEILKDKKIQPQEIEIDKDFDIEFSFLENNIKSIVEKPLISKLQELGYLKKYTSNAIDVEFEFTGSGVRKSIHSQENHYGGNLGDFAKVVLNMQKLLDNSVLLEIHADKGKGTPRENPQLVQTYVLLSAFREGNSIKPVQFEVKQYVDNDNRLYLAVALTKIETGVKGNTIPQNEASTSLLPVSEISIADLFKNVNIKDAKFLKYAPNQFLSEEQIKAKERELAIDRAKYSIKESSRVTNTELASMDDTALYIKNTKKANYIGMIFNGTKTEETRSRRTLDAYIGKEFFVTDGEKVYGKIVLGEPHKYTEEEFHKLENQKKHRVPKGDEYDVKPGGTKWAYPIESYERFDKPKKLSDSKEYMNSFQARQVLYSDRDDTSVSTRSLLANALEGAVQNDIEKNKLAQYKEKIALIESEQKKLHELREKLFTKGIKGDERRKIQDEATRTANRINTYDRQLFNLESTTALKNVLNREKALAVKRQKQKDAENLKAYKEKVAETTRELLKKNRESRAKAIEGRTKTEMRHKVKKVVNDLNNLLLKPTKERHVPEELRIAVAEALAIVNMDTVDADARVAKYNELIAKAKDPDIIASLTETRDRILNQGNKLGEKLTKLKDAYAMINASADGNLKSLYDDVIYSKIEKVQKDVGKTPLRNMTLKQLEDVYELYEMVLTTVRDSNEAFAENLKMTRQALGSNTFAEIKESNKAKDRIRFEGVKNFGWMYLKPMLAIKKIGSATLQKLWNNILYGQEVFAQDYDEAVKFAKEMKEKYGYSDWDLHKLYSFESKSGKVMKINLEQMMSIYAYSKRKQADEHIEFGGILLNESIIKVKNKLGKTVEYKVNDSTAYRLDKMQVGEIIATLEKEAPGAKDFVDEMQKYLSETMGEKGNEVSMKMYGIKLFKEEHYFPLKSSKDFMEAANAKLKGDVKIKNKGMTKATVEHANNPIVLENFLDVWGNHINEMAMYHGLVLPLEDFSRTLNYGFKADDKLNTDAESVKTALRSAFGESADNYLNELLKAINGGVLHDSSDGIANKMISTFKKSKVMASLSVIVQQPTAIIRAMGKIEPKYFVAQNFHHKQTWEELKKYCPTAIIKETGSFDTNMGRTIVDMIKEDRKFTEKVGDTLGKAPAYMDEMGWNMIWRALKKKVAAEQKLSGEALLQECGKQMTLIINETQVYDSVMSRNELMRSKGALTKMATAFMGEPTTVANMIYGAALDIKRGNKKMAGKTIAAVLSSVVINGLVSSLVYALRDDDEDETFLEKYLESSTTEVIEGFFPLTYIPYVKDAYSLFQGYDVERTDLALIGDVADAVNNFFGDVFDFEAYEGMRRSEIAKHIYESSVPLLTSICDMFGLPVGNILRDAKAIIVNDSLSMSKSSGEGIGLAIKEGLLNVAPAFVQNFVDDKKYHKLYLIANNGDTKYVKTEVAQMVAEKFDTYRNEEEDEEKAEKKAKQSVKSSFTAVYRDEYKKAYKNKDAKEMNRIRKFLYATGLWDYLSELDELLAKWREEA